MNKDGGSFFRIFLRFLSYDRLKLVFYLLFVLILALVNLALVYSASTLFNALYHISFKDFNHQNHTLNLLCLIGIFVAVRFIFVNLNQVLYKAITSRIRKEYLMSIYNNIQKVSYNFFTDNETSDVLDYIQKDIELFSKATKITLGKFLNSVTLLTISIATLALFSTKIALNLVIALILAILVYILFIKKFNDKVDQVFKSQEAIDSRLLDIIQNILSIIAANSFTQEKELIDKEIAVYSKQETALNFLFNTVITITVLAFSTVVFFNIVAAFKSYIAANIHLEELISLILMSYLVIYSLHGFLVSILKLNIITTNYYYCHDAEDMASYRAILSKSITPLKVRRGKVEFKKVSFDYQYNDNMFIDKSITLKAKEKTCLVGLSGSGKRTFAYMIPRILPTSSGKIEIDSQDITKVSLKSLRDSISFVSNDAVLFQRSIKDNISYGVNKYSEEDITEAATSANCHEMIMNLENGYATIFSEDLKLTEIQIFKILMARAILKNSPIVIIDEPKIPFETPSEKQIFESLKFLCQKKTSVTIAHHIETLKKADRILVFDKGTIVEDGTHAELLKNDSLYALLWAAHANGLLPEFLEN